MSTTAVGRQAEKLASEFLRHRGFEIIYNNWRTRWCEIDIVAARHNVVYFVEVKYRKSLLWGGGFEYITSRKLNQMQFAAQFWLAKNNCITDYRLAAIEVSGQPQAVTNFIDSIDI